MPNWDERGSILDHVFSAADMAPDAKGIPMSLDRELPSSIGGAEEEPHPYTSEVLHITLQIIHSANRGKCCRNRSRAGARRTRSCVCQSESDTIPER